MLRTWWDDVVYEVKNTAMSLLTAYKPTSPRERELLDLLEAKTMNLTPANLYEFLSTLYRIRDHEPVSEDFKNLVDEVIQKTSRLVRKHFEYEDMEEEF
jgi:hypothetical protein